MPPRHHGGGQLLVNGRQWHHGASSGSTAEERFREAIYKLWLGSPPGEAWNFSDRSAIMQDATTPITGFDQPIGLARGLSGNGYNLTQAAASSRPLFTDALPNGKPAAKFDGIDDGMSVPNFDLSSTDKVTVFAGARKLSDATPAMIVELSPNLNINPGTFWLMGPGSSGASSWIFSSRGSGTRRGDNATGFPAPASAVLRGSGDIAAPFSGLTVNGIPAKYETGSQGSENYGNYSLFIGYRGSGAALRYSGYSTSLTILGRLTTPAEDAMMAALLNDQIGAY